MNRLESAVMWLGGLISVVFWYMLYLLLFTGCAQLERYDHTENGYVITSVEKTNIKDVETTPTDKDLELLKVKSFKGFTKNEIQRFWQYSKIVDQATHSECFANYIKEYKDLLNNKDETRDELIESHRKEKPKLNFVMYYKNNGVVGYTYADSDTIWFNRKFHSKYTLYQSAANLAHERSHKLGYTHDFRRTARRSRQVPYPVGAAIKKCGANPNYKPEPRRICYRSWRQLWLRRNCYWSVN